MLDTLSWSIQLGRINHCDLSDRIVTKFRSSVQWLFEMIDLSSGTTPNMGTNDGASVLPLSACDYLDFRPCLQAAHAIADYERLLPPGKWDEQALWLNASLQTAAGNVVQSPAWRADVGGYYILRTHHSKSLIRCSEYRDRPGQSDNLHIDIWYRGVNVLGDAGSFMYYHDDHELANYFKSERAHNTAEFERTPQMLKGPSFLWIQWPEAKLTEFGEDTVCCKLTTRTQETARHHRCVERVDETFRITDKFDGDQSVTVRWRLNPDLNWQQVDEDRWTTLIDGRPYQIRFKSDDECSIRETVGMMSRYYGEKQDCPVIEVTGKLANLITVTGPLGNAKPATDQ